METLALETLHGEQVILYYPHRRNTKVSKEILINISIWANAHLPLP